MASSDGEVLYSTLYEPDRTRALDVLAFMLVPASLFFEPSDTEETRETVTAFLDSAKRDALLSWYAFHMGKDR